MKYTWIIICLSASTALALSILSPQIKGSGDLDGSTTHKSVQCYITDGDIHGTVSGRVIIKTSFLERGVILLLLDDKGIFLLSCGLSGTEKEGDTLFYFTMKKELVEFARLTICAKDKMYELPLNSIKIGEKKANRVANPDQ